MMGRVGAIYRIVTADDEIFGHEESMTRNKAAFTEHQFRTSVLYVPRPRRRPTLRMIAAAALFAVLAAALAACWLK